VICLTVKPNIEAEERDVNDFSRLLLCVEVDVLSDFPRPVSDKIASLDGERNDGVLSRRSTAPVPLPDELG
jgi:hypothetical protein